MVKLTEEMVVARTRVSDFATVKKLNCWGTELTDVSILRKMRNVEVLSLSVNNISTLADFQYCVDLKDLFVRKNNIQDLNQVCYLQGLPNLRNLWLGENPCAETDGYRLAVLRCLPNLEKLDDKIVTPEEVQTACMRGRVLIHPLDIDASSPHSDRGSPEDPVTEYLEEVDEQRRRYSSSSDQRSYEEQQGGDESRDTDKRNANYNSSHPQYSENSQYTYEQQNGRSKSKDDVLRNSSENSAATNPLDDSKDYEVRATSTRQNGEYEDRRQYSEYAVSDPNQSRGYTPVSPRTEYIEERKTDRSNYEYDVRRQLEYEDHRSVSQATRICEKEDGSGWVRRTDRKCKQQFHYQRRPVTRNSNILSAVLCLVKELDYPSLEVVEMAVRNRMDELEE